MLFYVQIKREFTRASWKRGQSYFREERVKDVRLDGDLVAAKIQGSEPKAYETAIVMSRGTIYNSKCSCPAHRVYETHCKHVAALAIWVVERGSLLRAGVTGGDTGVSTSEGGILLRNPQRAAEDPRLRKLLMAHPTLSHSRFIVRRDLMAGFVQGKDIAGNLFSFPVTLVEAAALLEHAKVDDEADKPAWIVGEAILYVKGLFQNKAFSGISVESAIRYIDPANKSVQIATLTYLTRQREPGLWRTTQGTLLRVLPQAQVPDEEVSLIHRLEYNKVFYQGATGLESLARLITHRHRDLIVFDPATLNIQLETVPLKLKSVEVGKKEGKSRQLRYVFEGADGLLDSAELEQLSRLGRLSSQYVLKGDKLYKFEISLAQLDRYSNRTGIAVQEGAEEEEAPQNYDGFGAVYDDSDSPLHPIAAFRLGLELGVQNFQVDEEWEEYHEWLKIFEKQKIPALPKVSYGFKLRKYQRNGLSWMWSLYHRRLAALLADDMGLGKTHQVLAFLASLYCRDRRARPKQPALVVAPTSVIAAWVQKLNKYKTGLKWHVFHGSGRKLPKTGVDIVITTYGILHREAALREREWHIIVLDEAQAIKNAATISARASRMLQSKFRIAMTGTPVENQASDLWSLMEFLLPGYLGSQARFKRLYGWGREIPSDFQAQALKRLVSPFLLRRTKAQVLTELPEKTEEIMHCEMTPVQKRAYIDCLNGADAVQLREKIKTGKKFDYANILSLLTRLKQICDHPQLAALTAGDKKVGKVAFEESGKWEAFEELLDEALGSNLKVVVFTQYLAMMDLVGRYLQEKGVGYTELRGDTPDRQARLEKFANEPACKVFVCSLLAGGLGIDLTAGSVCIHLDRWWNPARENQATDRLHRIGQTRGVQVFKLQIPGTVEDRIASIIETKVQLSGALIEESSVGLKAFSKKELLELFAPDSVA